MRVVVLSDTHMPRRNRVLPDALLQDLAAADLAIHLGDFMGPEVVEQIESLVPLIGVQGNNDLPDIKARFPLEREIELEGRRLYLLHGHRGGRTALAAARSAMRPGLSAVLFGHSHQPHLSHQNGVLLLNPGSPTERRWAPNLTYSVLDVDDDVRAVLRAV